MEYYLHGMILGLAYLAPIGMQNLYIINTALSSTLKQSLLVALIVIFFDITLAGACFFGVGYLLEKFFWMQAVLLAAGGIAVIKIGYDLWTSVVTLTSRQVMFSWTDALKTACIVTWFNPQAILDGTLLLGGMRAALPFSEGQYFIIGVFSASVFWFTSMALLVNMIKNRFTAEIVGYINRVCGIIIMLYGGKLLYHLANIIWKG